MMIKQIYLLNSTMTGVLQSSNSGSPIIDAGKNALLASKLKKAIEKITNSDIKVKAIDEDDLKNGISNDALLLINDKVEAVSSDVLSGVKNYLSYNALDITKDGLPNLVAKIAEKI